MLRGIFSLYSNYTRKYRNQRTYSALRNKKYHFLICSVHAKVKKKKNLAPRMYWHYDKNA